MNYIELIKRFWQLHELHQFSVTEIALYFHIVEICNRCNWTNPFNRNNARICADLDVSFNTLKNARNRLSQFELISFTSKSGNANVTYEIISMSSNFDEVTNEVTNEVTDEVSDEVGTRLDTTKDKLNKTKLNNKKDIDKSISKKIFIPPNVEEVRKYCLERGNSVNPDQFVNFYTAKGWFVGKNKMKDWRAAVHTWENNTKYNKNENNRTSNSKNGFDESLARNVAEGIARACNEV